MSNNGNNDNDNDNGILNDDQRLKLQEMIKANDAEDFTEHIRKNRQSGLIRTDVNHLLFLQNKYKRLRETNNDEFNRICINQCNFLYNNYTDIYNKIMKNIIDIKILYSLLDILKLIEDGKMDQHEGSYKVGEILKQIYIDSAIRKSEKIDKSLYKQEQNRGSKKIQNEPPVPRNISYNEYKLRMGEKE